MAKYVPDISTRRWLIIAKSRLNRPKSLKTKEAGPEQPQEKKVCVFCPGSESANYELYRLGKGSPFEPGWKVRVVANKYPITDFHEVIIHTPDDNKDIPKMSQEEIEDLIRVYRIRFLENEKHGHVLIFCNHGPEAGASIDHPHSQLVVVPRQLELETLSIERKTNIIHEGTLFDVYCPDFSQWPFEVWIAPRTRNRSFGQIEDHEIPELAFVLKKSLAALVHILEAQTAHSGIPKIVWQKGAAYNYYIHHAQDWYLRIIPRLVHRAGLELGTGISVNVVDPADAAEILRKTFSQSAS